MGTPVPSQACRTGGIGVVARRQASNLAGKGVAPRSPEGTGRLVDESVVAFGVAGDAVAAATVVGQSGHLWRHRNRSRQDPSALCVHRTLGRRAAGVVD